MYLKNKTETEIEVSRTPDVIHNLLQRLKPDPSVHRPISWTFTTISDRRVHSL